MTEKRYTLAYKKGDWWAVKDGDITLWKEEVIATLNKQDKRIQELKQEKERYKRLSEIKNEQINNRILTIREFIDNCSNEDVKNALQDLFYSEVNEYDLAKENRKLAEENDSLKKQIEMIGG